MNRIKINALRILILIFLILIVFLFIVFEFGVRHSRKERLEQEFEPALAPASLLFPNTDSKEDYSYSLTSSGRFVFTDNKSGEEFVVTPEGQVYEVLDDGSIKEVSPEKGRSVLAELAPIIAEDELASSILKPAEQPIEEEKEEIPVPEEQIVPRQEIVREVNGSEGESIPPITANIGGLSTTSAAPISSPQYSSYNPYDSTAAIAAAALASQQQTSSYDSLNAQSAKKAFLNDFSDIEGADQLTTYDLAAGTIINMTLITGLNSDLPGQIVAQVNQNVYDTLSGKNLLIPKGTRLIATYDSSVSWGQNRALVAWTQMIRPDGFILNLPGLPGIDAQGYAGYQDKVDTHFWSFIGAAFLASIMDLGVDEIILQAEYAGVQNSGLNAVEGFTGTLNTAGQKYLSKVIDRQPTLRIRPGRKVNLLVTQTLSLKPYDREVWE